MTVKLTLRVTIAVLAAALAHAIAFAQMPPSAVVLASVGVEEITPTVPIAGTVHSRNDIQITVGVDGQLKSVAEPGTLVAKGDVIAQVDTVRLRLQRDEQVGQAERARAQLGFLEAQVKRQRDLHSSNSVSATQKEQTEADRDVAASDLRIAQTRIRQIDDQLERATIRSQFDGVIAERMRREGEDVARGTVLARLVDLENLEVRVQAPLRYSRRVRPGDELKVYGFESERSGTVRSVVPSMDARAQTFELRIDLDDDGGDPWSIGELVSVGVPMRAGKESLVVPRDALILRREGTYVFRVDAENQAQRVEVTTGDSRGHLVAVEGALDEGDRVVVRGAESLQDGASVAVVTSSGDGQPSD